MKHLLVLVAILTFATVAHAEKFWAGVWYNTKSPTPSDRLQGPLEVRLQTNGTLQANFIRKSGQGYRTIPSVNGSWTQDRRGVYHFTFLIGPPVANMRFTGTIKHDLMTGRFETPDLKADEGYNAGKFQCTWFDDED